MIRDFADFCTWMYVVVDELYQQLPPCCKPSRGPRPACSDSELLTMILVGECCGWHAETVLVQQWRQQRALFPHVPERSRFHRRRRQLLGALTALRQAVLARLDLARDRQCAIDSLPLPVLQFHLVPGAASRADWQAAGAAVGFVRAKRQYVFGYKLHLLVTRNGVIREVVLAPANVPDLVAGAELLEGQHGLVVVGDKAYVSAPLAAALQAERGVTLLALTRANQRTPLPEPLRRQVIRWRQIVETVHEQLRDQFGLPAHRARSFWGLCTRLLSKLTAHTLCIHLNRVLGNAAPLQIKALAFPSN